MKNIFFLLFAFLLLNACKDDDQITTPIDDDNPVIPEDTIELDPAKYIAGDTTYGYVLGVWQDSVEWEGSASIAACQFWHLTHPDDFINIGFDAYHRISGFLRNVIYLSEIQKDSIGSYKISKGQWDQDDGLVGASFHTATDDGDVGEDNYIVDETATDNLLTITEVDTVNQIYRGHFTVSFEINNPQGGLLNPNNPEKFRIKDAEFWVKLH